MDSGSEATRPSGLEQLVVLLVGILCIAVGLYGGAFLAAAGPASLPLGAASLLAAAAYWRRPDASWGAKVAWLAFCACAALFAVIGILDLLMPTLFGAN